MNAPFYTKQKSICNQRFLNFRKTAFSLQMLLFLACSPSQALTRQLSQRESLWHSDKVSGYTGDPLCGKPFLKGKRLGKKMKLAGTAKGSHFEERLPPLRGKMSRSDKRGSLSPKVTERARPLTMCSSYYVPLSAVW